MAPPKKGKDYTWIPKVEKEHRGKHIPNGQELPPDTYNKSPGEIARRLKQHSKDFNQAQQRLTFYRNRQGRNLNPTEKGQMEHAEDALREAYGTQLTPAEKLKKQQEQSQASTLNASARIRLKRTTQ